MGEVIQMTSHSTVKPKSEGHNYKGHRIVLSYLPHAEQGKRWQWHLKFTRVYEFAGVAATQELSLKHAKAKIEHMIERVERVG